MLLVRYLFHYVIVRYLLGTEDHYVTSPLSVRDRGPLLY